MSGQGSRFSVTRAVSEVVLTIATAALMVVALLRFGWPANWGFFVAALAVSLLIGTVIHEAGHALAALAFGRPVAEVRLGSGPVLAHFRLRNTVVRIGTWPLGGGKVWLPGSVKLGRREAVIFIISGSTVNAVAAALAFAFSAWSPAWLIGFFFVNGLLAVYGFIPTGPGSDGPSDATQLWLRLGWLPREYRQALAESIPHPLSSVRLDDLPLELWTASADRALSVALQIAQSQGAVEMGTEHLLAGVLQDRESAGARTLTDMGFSGDRLLPLLIKGSAAAPPTWSSEALMAVGGALATAEKVYGAGTGELCCGVLGAKGNGYKVLKQAHITLGGFREELEPLRQQEILVGCTNAMFAFWATRATTRLRAKRFVDSRADFMVMARVASDPHERAVSLNNAAWTALMAGDPAWRDEALENVQQALVIEPDRPEFRSTLAFALLETGNVVEAVAALESFDDSLAPPAGKASNLCLRAIATARLGDMEASARHEREAEAFDPECDLLDRARAEFLVASPRTPNAVTPST